MLRNWNAIENLITAETCDTCKIIAAHPVGGGCINDSFKIMTAGGETYFVKRNRKELLPMFEAEAHGLEVLRGTDTITVPSVIGFGTEDASSFLVMKWIESARKNLAFSDSLGQRLAELHQFQSLHEFGLEDDNFIGTTPQKNRWDLSWSRFFVEQRLQVQIDLAAKKGFVDVVATKDSILNRVAGVLNYDCRPSLIHGDLWSGNYMIGCDGEPVFIDPAPYWADREAEFGILTMFGGFDETFFSAYSEAFPFEKGFEERLPIYQLYHYLNHLNLFGISYAPQVRAIIRKFS